MPTLPRDFEIRSRQGGFTLLEVLISIALLALLSIATYQATTRSYEVNRTITGESEDFMNLSTALQVMDQDVQQIYSPLLPEDFEKKVPGQQRPLFVAPNQSQPSAFWSAPVRADGLRRTRFVGTRQKITFIANGNRRMEEGATQSDLIAVTWELAQDSSGAWTLWRAADWNAFDYGTVPQRKATRVPVLSKISSGKFSFFRSSTNVWDDQWDSEGQLVKPESRFPDLVKISLEVPDPVHQNTSLSWESVLRPALLLNARPEGALPQATGGAR